MQKILFSLMLTFGMIPVAEAQTVTTKQDDIRQLVEMTGTVTIMKQSMSRFIEQFKKTNTILPEEFWTRVEKEANYNELIDQLIPIYDAHYTSEEVKGLLAFYKSSLGQKSIRELPIIMQESSAVGRVWGERLGKRIAEQIQQEKEKPKN